MKEIIFLWFAGVIPVIAQYNHGYQNEQVRYTDYGDFGQFRSSNEGQSPHGSEFALQQPSFFGSYENKLKNENHHSGSASSLVTGSYGGLTPPPLTSPDQVKNVHNYVASERHASVPSSLQELEESYIRSLSSGSSSKGKNAYSEPFGESQNNPSGSEKGSGLENFAGFLVTKRLFEKNSHLSALQEIEQLRTQTPPPQSAPLTYEVPLLNQQVSASTNNLDTRFGRKESGKTFNFRHKNVIPTFPDFSDRPPIPEEPEIPSEEEEIEEATRRPPEKYLPPNARIRSKGYSSEESAPTTLSSPSVFDPSFPVPVLQRGFIPSFGPPTKQPYFTGKTAKGKKLAEQEELLHNHLASQIEVSTTSPVPVLRPKYTKSTKDIPPDEVTSDSNESPEEKPSRGKVYKHISIHVAPEDVEESSPPRVIKVAKKPEKHIKVIFIKPPDTPTQKTEVEMPPGPQQKTLVYVLSESGGARTPIKLVKPAPLKPAPPQVFFLRYNDPRIAESLPSSPPSNDEDSSEDDRFHKSTSPKPIKQLASPLDPDAEFLRSAPSPVLPTYPSEYQSPTDAALAHFALQSTISSPSSFSNSILTDPTNSRFHQGIAASTNTFTNINPHPNTQSKSTFKHNEPKARTTQQPLTNAFLQNYYKTLYQVTPPPNHNLLSHYQTDNDYQPLSNSNKKVEMKPVYQVVRPKAGPDLAPSSIQGLYTVAPNLETLPGINFNSLVQNPDGNNPPRSVRNFATINYAPALMHNASGSDQTPAFTSPAEFIKSLLGESYMFYNSIANSPAAPQNQSSPSPDPPTTTSTTTTTTPSPILSEPKAQHHTIPLILNWSSLQNLSSHFPPNSGNAQQPFTLVIGADQPDLNFNANFPFQNGLPVDPHLRPMFPLYTTTSSSPKPQFRISATPPPTPAVAENPLPHNAVVNRPVVLYAPGIPSPAEQQQRPPKSHETVSSHINNLFNSFLKHGIHRSVGMNESSEQSAEYYSQSESSSGSDESTDIADLSKSQLPSSGEEVTSNYSAERPNQPVTPIIYISSNNKSKHRSSSSKSGRRNRKRVNPANVKPGRRLRKVRKPNKSKSNTSAREPHPGSTYSAH